MRHGTVKVVAAFVIWLTNGLRDRGEQGRRVSARNRDGGIRQELAAGFQSARTTVLMAKSSRRMPLGMARVEPSDQPAPHRQTEGSSSLAFRISTLPLASLIFSFTLPLLQRLTAPLGSSRIASL